MATGGAAGRTAAGSPEIVVAILLMVAATQLQPVMDTIAKWLGAQISPMQVAWGRMFFQTLLTLPLVLWLYGAAGMLPRPLGLQLLRGFFLAGMNVTFFFAIAAMPIADALAIVFVAPLIVTALSAILLGEHVGPRLWAAVAVGLVGALIVIRPGSGSVGLVGLLPLGAAFSYAGYLIVTRSLSAKVPPMQIHFFSGLACTAMLTVPLVIGAGLDIEALAPVMPSALQWSLLLAIGAISMAAHLLIILAYSRAPASVLAPISYLEIVGATVLGFLVFADFPDGWTWAGAAVIISSGLYVLLGEGRHRVSPRFHGRRAAGR